MKRLTVWNVYKKGDDFRVGYEHRGGLTWHMISEEEPRIYWETIDKLQAIAKAKELNTPTPELKWELVE